MSVKKESCQSGRSLFNGFSKNNNETMVRKGQARMLFCFFDQKRAFALHRFYPFQSLLRLVQPSVADGRRSDLCAKRSVR
jgi:hypothetical protein